MAMSPYEEAMLEIEERKAAALEHIGSRVFEFLNQHEEHHEAILGNLERIATALED